MKQLVARGTKVFVKVGGGYEKLDIYLEKSRSPSERALYTKMKAYNMSLD